MFSLLTGMFHEIFHRARMIRIRWPMSRGEGIPVADFCLAFSSSALSLFFSIPPAFLFSPSQFPKMVYASGIFPSAHCLPLLGGCGCRDSIVLREKIDVTGTLWWTTETLARAGLKNASAFWFTSLQKDPEEEEEESYINFSLAEFWDEAVADSSERVPYPIQ